MPATEGYCRTPGTGMGAVPSPVVREFSARVDHATDWLTPALATVPDTRCNAVLRDPAPLFVCLWCGVGRLNSRG